MPTVKTTTHWMSEFSLVLQETYKLEALNYDFDVPCFCALGDAVALGANKSQQ